MSPNSVRKIKFPQSEVSSLNGEGTVVRVHEMERLDLSEGIAIESVDNLQEKSTILNRNLLGRRYSY